MYQSSTDYSGADLKRYAAAVGEMAERFSLFGGEAITNFYVGGGTPTVYSPADLQTLLAPFSRLQYESSGERTCEMSPTTAVVEHVDVLAQADLNRISIGVQSFEKAVLDAVNREYADPQRVGCLARRARELGLVDVNVDLMFGLPGATAESVSRSAVLASETGALSISIYNFRRRRGELDLDEEVRAEMVRQFHAARAALEKRGWECHAGDDTTEYHLFYSPERRRDTVRYRTSPNGVENYSVVGLGAHANGFDPALAYACASDGKSFSEGAPVYRCWTSSEDKQIRLGVINLLYANGNVVDKAYFRQAYGLDFNAYFKSEIEELLAVRKAEDDEARLKLLPESCFDGTVLQRFFLPPEMLNVS